MDSKEIEDLIKVNSESMKKIHKKYFEDSLITGEFDYEGALKELKQTIIEQKQKTQNYDGYKQN